MCARKRLLQRLLPAMLDHCALPLLLRRSIDQRRTAAAPRPSVMTVQQSLESGGRQMCATGVERMSL